LPRLCVAQAEAAHPLYQAYKAGWDKFRAVTAKPTLASAIQIGNPVSVRKAVKTLQTFNGVVEQASEAELSDAAARADRTGLFNCPHTGVALAALEKLVARGEIGRSERTVVVSTANGLKFTDFKVQYHERKLAAVPDPKFANALQLLPNDYVAVRDAVRRELKT
jgi:threonine synthase